MYIPTHCTHIHVYMCLHRYILCIQRTKTHMIAIQMDPSTARKNNLVWTTSSLDRAYPDTRKEQKTNSVQDPKSGVLLSGCVQGSDETYFQPRRKSRSDFHKLKMSQGHKDCAACQAFGERSRTGCRVK